MWPTLWSELFQERTVEVLTARQSDHKALLLDVGKGCYVMQKRRRVFRFDAKWIMEEGGGTMIEKAWARRAAEQNPLRKMQVKLMNCTRELVRWSACREKEDVKEIMQKIERLKIEQENEGPHNAEIIKILHKKLRLLLEQEDMKWRQRTKRTCCKLGEKNSKFFHSCASQR